MFSDGGRAPLRATGFAFEKPVADALFGTPMVEGYDIPDEEARMQVVVDTFKVQRNTAEI